MNPELLNDSPAGDEPRALVIARRVVGVLMWTVFALLIANTLNSHAVGKFGFNYYGQFFKYLSILVLLRAALAVPWRRIALSGRPAVWLFTLCACGGFFLYLTNLLQISLRAACEATVVARTAYKGHTDMEIMSHVADTNKYYPNTKYIQMLLDEVPEGDGIAYISEQRAHVLTYEVYPRRLYVLPELQVIVNETTVDGWRQRDRVDPLAVARGEVTHEPVADPLDPEVQRALREMIRDRDIKWFTYYDSLNPERSYLRRIAP